MTKSIIKVKNLSKKFKKRIIFNNLNLSIQENNITTIYGKSGSGKTTLLNIIGLLEKPTSGELILFDQKAPRLSSIKARKYLRYKLSYLFQNYALLEDQSIKKNLALAYSPKFYKKSEFNDKKAKLIARFLPNISQDIKVGALSGGEQQRVALIRALLKPGKILLCDEPTGSLDPENRDKLFAALQYAKECGKTIVIVSHDPYIIEHSDVAYDIATLHQ